MENVNVKTKEILLVEDSVLGIQEVSAKFVLGACCLVGAWSLVCLASGILSAGGPVALVGALFSVI